MTSRKWVTLHILWKAVSSDLFLWPTACEWHCIICERQSHHICSMTDSLWVILNILWKAVSHFSNHLAQSVSDIEHFEKNISSYYEQEVGDLAHFVKGNLIRSFQWPTVCEWHCTFCERQSHQIFSYDQQLVSNIQCIFCERHSHQIFYYDQQRVSDIAQPVKNSLIRSFPMTNSKWVNILWNAVSSDFFLWPIASEWHCTFCERQTHQIFSYVWPTVCEWDWTFCERLQSHHIFSYDQQEVNNIAHFVNSSLIRSFPMINRELVTVFHILWKVVSSDLFLWPTDCGWIQDFVKGSLIRSFPITNSLWVPLHTLWRAVSSYLFLWPTVCEWQCTLWNSERDPNNDLFLWPPACEWHCTFYERQSHHIWSTGSE